MHRTLGSLIGESFEIDDSFDMHSSFPDLAPSYQKMIEKIQTQSPLCIRQILLTLSSSIYPLYPIQPVHNSLEHSWLHLPFLPPPIHRQGPL
jgi:hypothetical protein